MTPVATNDSNMKRFNIAADVETHREMKRIADAHGMKLVYVPALLTDYFSSLPESKRQAAYQRWVSRRAKQPA